MYESDISFAQNLLFKRQWYLKESATQMMIYVHKLKNACIYSSGNENKNIYKIKMCSGQQQI